MDYWMRKRGRWAAAVLVLAGMLTASTAQGVKVGDKVGSVKVKDANDNPAWIPDIGKKVVTLFYTDPDVKDQNEAFRELLKANKLDRTHYRGMGVVNLEDTWKPNFIIRKVVRDKIEKYKSTILTDPDHILKKKWGLGKVDDKDVVIIIDKSGRIAYLKKGPMSPSERQQALNLVKRLIAADK